MSIEDSEALASKLKKFHIHVYKVSGLFEVDVHTENDKRALEIALDAVEQSEFKEADCNVVAVIPGAKEEKDGEDNHRSEGTVDSPTGS